MHAFSCRCCPVEQSGTGILLERLQPFTVALCGDAAVARRSAVAQLAVQACRFVRCTGKRSRTRADAVEPLQQLQEQLGTFLVGQRSYPQLCISGAPTCRKEPREALAGDSQEAKAPCHPPLDIERRLLQPDPLCFAQERRKLRRCGLPAELVGLPEQQ